MTNKKKRRVMTPDSFADEDMTLEQAEVMRHTDDPKAFDKAILRAIDLMSLQIPKRRYLLENLISTHSITLINGFRGDGKSWLAASIANEVASGGRLGPWEVMKVAKVLYIDGEMDIETTQDRVKRLNSARSIPLNLYIYPESYAFRIGMDTANLLDPKWRDRIHEFIIKTDIRLLILDNLASLAPGIDENAKMEFDPINRWMLELRFHGVSIVMVHHLGKSGNQRGTSAHEDHADVILQLRKPKKYESTDGCKFVIAPTKDRTNVTGGEAYTLQLMDLQDGGAKLDVVEDSSGDKATMALIEHPEMNEKEARALGISRATFYRAKKDMKSKYQRHDTTLDT
jgi:putative DNA primase/helicase